MPYSLQKSGRGYYVITKASGRRHSKRPLSLKRAKAQMRALYANEKSNSNSRYKRMSKKKQIVIKSRYTS